MSVGGGAPAFKKLVDLVDRGPEDTDFYPFDSNNTVFRRVWPAYHNTVSETVEVGYKGAARWGERITIALNRHLAGDMLQWVALRFRPVSWLGSDVESLLSSGVWNYADVSGAWMWASSLGTVAIRRVSLEINDVVVESWSGEWMDIWSRMALDAGRSGTWDADLNGRLPCSVLSDTSRDPRTTFLPTEDGYITCWLPLSFFRRPGSAFPLVALNDQTEFRIHVWFNDFENVVRRRCVPRATPTETPLGSTVVLNSGSSQQTYVLSAEEPAFDDFSVWVGSAHLEDPLRSRYMLHPLEMLYEPVVVTKYDVPAPLTAGAAAVVPVSIPITEFNGPIRTLIWFIRRKAVWQFNEWTNYGALLEPALLQTVAAAQARQPTAFATPAQQPLLVSARLMIGNAVWRSDSERWWRQDFGLDHRGGARLTSGMVYGYDFGSAGLGGDLDNLQPEGTVNASRVDGIRLDLQIAIPVSAGGTCVDPTGSDYEVWVMGVGLNWMRIVAGQAQPVFQ